MQHPALSVPVIEVPAEEQLLIVNGSEYPKLLRHSYLPRPIAPVRFKFSIVAPLRIAFASGMVKVVPRRS